MNLSLKSILAGGTLLALAACGDKNTELPLTPAQPDCARPPYCEPDPVPSPQPVYPAAVRLACGDPSPYAPAPTVAIAIIVGV